MKTTCPQCGHIFETAKARREPVARLNDVYAGFGLEEATVREYIDCFRVSRESANSIPKEMRLLKELIAMWAVESFFFRGRNWNTTREKIRDAMLAACNRQLIGLSNHNYIKKILYTWAQAEGSREERERHEAATKGERRPAPKTIVWPSWCIKDVEKCDKYNMGLLGPHCQKCKWKQNG